MSLVDKRQWERLERWRATAFLLGGAVFAVDVALVASHVASGTEPTAFGQALVGTAWTASFVGLLGMYPSLSDRSRWPARIGAICAVIGGLTMAVMALVSLGYATGILSGELSEVAMFFLPGVAIGTVLGFGSFGVASLRTDIYSRSVGGLFLLLVLTFLFNIGSSIAGVATMSTVLGVVVVLALSKLTLGYLFRTEDALADREGTGASSDSVA
ncbi:MAG: hypothetical protein V5A62_10615 [Haloarculaceae archaeon]